MTRRDLVVLAVSATGPDPQVHSAVGIAAVNTATKQAWEIVLPLSASNLAAADPEMLHMSGYYTRGLAQIGDVRRAMLGEQLAALSDALTGNTIGGVFPQFSAAFVHRTLADAGLPSGWHYRLAELGALTAGAFGMEPTAIPKLSMCCRLWGVPAVDLETPHGAAFAAAACFEHLAEYNATAPGPQIIAENDDRLSVVQDLPAGL
ncbi:hypothetical protein SIM91_00180 [Rhodococcus opacus]|uniref:hypothetical protein n=1 Tax=Rhodococcus opacus TaxID=37919 RepID=UPI0029C3352D|nr:hypothetical protein [Rhodococcus opacus]MDX5961788.1 hypothetical protein [Rhodococcus opacus]